MQSLKQFCAVFFIVPYLRIVGPNAAGNFASVSRLGYAIVIYVLTTHSNLIQILCRGGGDKGLKRMRLV